MCIDVCVHDLANVHTVYVCVHTHLYNISYLHIHIYMILLRQDPEVCPDSQRVPRSDDHHDDDDDDGGGGGNQYAPHKQHVLNPY